MFRLGKKGKPLQKIANGLRFSFAFIFFALTVLQGLTLCFCPPDPDACGEHCHDCGSVPEPQSPKIEHMCDHLTVAELPPGEETASGFDALLAGLFTWVLRQEPAAFSNAVFTYPERPPDVLYPHLTFIACSTQILC